MSLELRNDKNKSYCHFRCFSIIVFIMVIKAPLPIVEVDVDLKESISRKAFVKLLSDLVKHLLLVKNQIPLHYEAIALEVGSDSVPGPEGDSGDDFMEEEASSSSRETARERLQRARKRRSKAHLLKKGRKLMSEVSSVVSSLETELESDDVTSVSFMFGATSHSVREVYTVQVQDWIVSEARADLELNVKGL